jgi:hypothetical protein
MTRLRKYDPEVLEREYIYDSSQKGISITLLAEKHGMARSGLADMALKGRWYEKRKTFREQLGMKTIEALGEEWAQYGAAVREKMMTTAMTYLDKYTDALHDGTIKVNTRDMLGMAAMIRALIADAAATAPGEEALIDPDNVTLDPDDYRRALASIKQIEDGIADDRDDAAGLEATGTEGPRQN